MLNYKQYVVKAEMQRGVATPKIGAAREQGAYNGRLCCQSGKAARHGHPKN